MKNIRSKRAHLFCLIAHLIEEVDDAVSRPSSMKPIGTLRIAVMHSVTERYMMWKRAGRRKSKNRRRERSKKERGGGRKRRREDQQWEDTDADDRAGDMKRTTSSENERRAREGEERR